jgi:hypothetical protein
MACCSHTVRPAGLRTERFVMPSGFPPRSEFSSALALRCRPSSL